MQAGSLFQIVVLLLLLRLFLAVAAPNGPRRDFTECKYNLMGEDFDSLEGGAAV